MSVGFFLFLLFFAFISRAERWKKVGGWRERKADSESIQTLRFESIATAICVTFSASDDPAFNNDNNKRKPARRQMNEKGRRKRMKRNNNTKKKAQGSDKDCNSWTNGCF